MLLASSPSGLYSYTVHEQSWVSLAGSSNVNRFECLSEGNHINGNLEIDISTKNNAVEFSDALMKLKIKSFDCRNPLLNKDFYNSLGIEKTPYISIELIDASPTRQMQLSSTMVGVIDATIAITINEHTNIVELPIEWQRVETETYRFAGTKVVFMSDFEITPPSPAFGLIKVNDEISISFSMLVEVNTSSLAITN